jgi:LysR family nod box-dependent transcriptional activator
MRLAGLNLNLLIALDALLEAQSVSIAAEKLNRSQSTVSGSLQKLREYFDDELLVSVGRSMVRTPRADELAAALKTALLGLESAIANSGAFVPENSRRHFHLITSDYCYQVLLADVLRRIYHLAPNVTFAISPPNADSFDRLNRGDADALITIEALIEPPLLHQPLLNDRHAVVSWTGNERCRDGLTEELFFELAHVVVAFSPGKVLVYPEQELGKLHRPRRVEITVPTFANVPLAVIGTERIGVMFRRHAEKLAAVLPLHVHDVPAPLPDVTEAIAYHSMRSSDQGLRWLISELQAEAQKI